jgi:hypothetical protein
MLVAFSFCAVLIRFLVGGTILTDWGPARIGSGCLSCDRTDDVSWITALREAGCRLVLAIESENLAGP